MKWLGAIILIIITTFIGLEYSTRLKSRPKHIHQIKNALLILEAEILYSQTKIKDAFETISKQIPNPTKELFYASAKDLSTNKLHLFEIWENNVQRYIERSALTEKEKEILLQFGKTLGQYDMTQQQKQLAVTNNHLHRLLQEAETHRDQYANIAKSLGVLSGVFIVLLLI
ncbi:MAG TPA: stage III sporulation protein SpoIIIAB [Bacillota bacterium]|nr:stage III sporulation protein SpoIIIAB [Bacillota bacterium]